MVTRIIVNLQFEATHSWPDCNIPWVGYLRNTHRHVFHVTMKKKVNHDNRDVEFIDFKYNVLKHIRDRWEFKNMGTWSCEKIANYLLMKFECDYVCVMEDGENGAEVYKDK